MRLHKPKRQNKTKEWVRNIFLVILAVGVVIIFFNLDIMTKGESVFSQSTTNKLTFVGDLKEKEYTAKEVAKIRALIKKNPLIKTAKVQASLQDNYKNIIDSSQIIFEVHMVMADGATITTTTKRTTRKNLAKDILEKINRDTRVYKKLTTDGKQMKSLINAQ